MIPRKRYLWYEPKMHIKCLIFLGFLNTVIELNKLKKIKDLKVPFP